MAPKEFVTACLYAASIVSLVLHLQPEYRVENGRTLFVFPASDDLYKALNAYNNGLLQVSAYEYAGMIKRQRAEMLMRRGTGVQK